MINLSNGSDVSRYDSNVSNDENLTLSTHEENDNIKCGNISCNDDEKCQNDECVKKEGEITPIPVTTLTPPGDGTTSGATEVFSTDNEMSNTTTPSSASTADNKMKLVIYSGAGSACVVLIIVGLCFLYKRFRGPRKGGRFPESETPLETLRSTGTIRDVESFPKLPPIPTPRPRPQPRPRQTLRRPSYENDENIYVDPDDLNQNHYVKS